MACLYRRAAEWHPLVQPMECLYLSGEQDPSLKNPAHGTAASGRQLKLLITVQSAESSLVAAPLRSRRTFYSMQRSVMTNLATASTR
jgi:hypothetical protein